MKIVCIGRNYRDHARELNNDIPDKPIFFMKPDSSILEKNKPFFYPSFSKEIHYETEIVLKICRLGRHIEERFAHRYYNELTVGIDFTARDIQRACIKNGLPWDIAKGFDQSAVIGTFVKKTEFPDITNMCFSLDIDGKRVQQGNTADMIFSFDTIIAYISQFMTLKTGDLIFTGTPAGVGPVALNNRLQASIDAKVLLDFRVK